MSKICSLKKAIKKFSGILRTEVTASRIDLAVVLDGDVTKLAWVLHGPSRYVFLFTSGTYDNVSFSDADNRMQMIVLFPKGDLSKVVNYDKEKKVKLIRVEDDIFIEDI